MILSISILLSILLLSILLWWLASRRDKEADYLYREMAGRLTPNERAAQRAAERAVHDKRHDDMDAFGGL